MIQEVHVPPQPLDRYAPFARPEQLERVRTLSAALAVKLDGRAVWNINSTAAGGGVAELLQSKLGYVRGSGIDGRWLAISGPPEFFQLTRKLHDALHGMGTFRADAADRGLYEQVLGQNAAELDAVIENDDVVILHDPQTVGLAPHLLRRGVTVVWRSHIGQDRFDPVVVEGWRFLLPYLENVETVVFTRPSFVPEALRARRVKIIPPTIDPNSAKNQALADETVRAILVHIGVIGGPAGDGHRTFLRQDGSPGRVDRFVDVVRTGPAIDWDMPMITQVSRWDHLKDPIGVLNGFVRCLDAKPRTCGALVLAGPNVHGVADDPAAVSAYNDVLTAWRDLPHNWRHHVHLVTLPMADIDENAAIVNALQRHASIVVQKSLHEGFGLTVAEAMWKHRPVVASAVGGIRDQIEDQVDGLLIQDATDLDAFAQALLRLLEDEPLRHTLGERAHFKVRDHFLGLETLTRYAELLLQIT